MSGKSTFLTQVIGTSEEIIRQDREIEDEIAELQQALAGVTQMSQSTLLLQKRKEMVKVDNDLEEMKRQYEERMRVCYIKQKEFESKKAELSQSVEKFQRFINENDHKKQLAENKEKTELRQKEDYIKELQKLMGDLDGIKQEKERLKAAHAKIFKYQQYLEATVEVSAEQYEEVEDILNRHKTLDTTQSDLKKSLVEETEKLEGLRASVSSLKRDTQNLILVKNSEIHRHQKKIESLRSLSAQMDTKREKEDRSAFLKLREYGQVIMSIKNLHQRCLAKRHRRTVKRLPVGAAEAAVIKDLKDKLNYIQNRMVMLQEIREGYTQFLEEKDTEAKIASMRAAAKDPKSKSARALGSSMDIA